MCLHYSEVQRRTEVGNIFLHLDRLVKRYEKHHQLLRLLRCRSGLQRSAKPPWELVKFSLRHRQACQKLRENITSFHGFCSILLEGKKRLEHDSNFKRDGEVSLSEALATGRGKPHRLFWLE